MFQGGDEKCLQKKDSGAEHSVTIKKLLSEKEAESIIKRKNFLFNLLNILFDDKENQGKSISLYHTLHGAVLSVP